MQKDEKKELVRTIDEMITILKEMKGRTKMIKIGKFTTNQHQFILDEVSKVSLDIVSLKDRTFFNFLD